MTTITTPTLTAEQVWDMPKELPCQLVEGVLQIMPLAGQQHGEISLNIGSVLRAHVRQHDLGKVYSNDTGFVLKRDPDTVLGPDIAFVRKERLQYMPRGFYEGPPDLAVEVVSPSDRGEDVDEKRRRWLDHGAQTVWTVYPTTRSVTVHEPGKDALILHEDDTITGGEVVKGFTCSVREFFE